MNLVRMLPVWLALCDLEAPGWGEPWFPHCASVASWLTDFCMALCGLLFAIVLHCHTNPWGDTMLSSLLAFSNCPWTDQLTTGRAGFCFCFLFVFFAFWCFCLFCLFLGFLCLLFVLHGDSSMDYDRSNSVLFCITLSSWPMLPLH